MHTKQNIRFVVVTKLYHCFAILQRLLNIKANKLCKSMKLFPRMCKHFVNRYAKFGNDRIKIDDEK